MHCINYVDVTKDYNVIINSEELNFTAVYLVL